MSSYRRQTNKNNHAEPQEFWLFQDMSAERWRTNCLPEQPQEKQRVAPAEHNENGLKPVCTNETEGISLSLTKQLTRPLLGPSCWMWEFSNELRAFYLFPVEVLLSRTYIANTLELCPWVGFGLKCCLVQNKLNNCSKSNTTQQINTAKQNKSLFRDQIPACSASNKASRPSIHCLLPHLTLAHPRQS